MTQTQRLEVGECIRIPAWRTEGQIIATRPATLGSADAQEVQIEQLPDDPRPPRWYRLEPTEYEVL